MLNLISQIKQLRYLTSASIIDCKKAIECSSGNIEKAITLLKERGILKASLQFNKIAKKGSIFIKNTVKKCIMIELNCQTDFATRSFQIGILANKIKNFLYTLSYLNKNICNNLEDIKLKDLDDKYLKYIINKSISILKENITLKYFILMDSELIGSYVHHNKLAGSVISINFKNQYRKKIVEKLKTLAKDLAMHIVALSPKFIGKNNADPKYILDQKKIILKQKNAILKNKSEKMVDKIIHGNLNKILSDVCLLDQKFIKDQSITVQKEITKYEKSLKIAISLTFFFIFRIKG